jgi:hypothetical protein
MFSEKTSLVDNLEKGLLSGCTTSCIDEYIHLLETKPQLFFLPSRFSADNPDIVDMLWDFKAEYFSIIDSLKSSPIAHDLSNSGYSYRPKMLSSQHLKELTSICRHSWALRREPQHALSGGCSLSPNSIRRIFQILASYDSLNPILTHPSMRLDGLRFLVSDNVPGIGSRLWHRDSVGNRLKIFLILGSFGASPVTAVIPNSQKDSTFSKNIDMLRTRSDMSLSKLLQTQLQKTLSGFYMSSRVAPQQEAGDLFALDTNAFHRAEIPIMHTGNSSYGKRMHMVIEYMPRKASNFCKILGPCAPGHKGDYPIRFPIEDTTFLKDFGFDNECMSYCSDGIVNYLHNDNR